MTTAAHESPSRPLSRRSLSVPSDSRPPARYRIWARSRTLSVPDVNRLKAEWERFQKSEYDPDKMALGRLQVRRKREREKERWQGHSREIRAKNKKIDVLNIRTDTPLKRPRMRVKMGSAQYFTARSEKSTGDWNEGFIFVVSYHAQLFDTVDVSKEEKKTRSCHAYPKYYIASLICTTNLTNIGHLNRRTLEKLNCVYHIWRARMMYL